jgi:hypothetical protein
LLSRLRASPAEVEARAQAETEAPLAGTEPAQPPRMR